MSKTLIIDSFSAQVSNSMKKPENRKALMNIISRYIDKNSEKLATTGPVKRLIFSDADREPVYELVGLSPNIIATIASKVPELSRGVNTSNPFNIILTLLIRYFRMNKFESERKVCNTYFILSMYPSLHKKYFKFEPNENIMSFTINALSNKYKIKQQGTLLGSLVDTAEVCESHFSKNLVRGTDKDIADFIAAMKTRTNAFLKNIAIEFMKQHQSGRYLNYDTDNDDPDNFSKADSNSLVIERITTAVVLNLSSNGPDTKCITIASKMNKVSVNAMRTTINSICKDKANREKIRELVSAILYDFLFDGSHNERDIHDMRFILYATETYKKSNTINTNIVKIKNIMDGWLEKYSEEYKKTNRVGTLNLFRRALYMFFVFTIQKTSV